MNNNKEINIKLDSLNLSKKSVESILESIRVVKKRLSAIENQILEAHKSQYSPSREIPGETGLFDGEYLVTKEGIKYEVPKNYSAKSLLVIGDELKKYQEDGKDFFKIVNKIPRKKVTGMLSKKDGRWVVLTELGKSYFLSKQAVEFRNMKQGDRVIVVIPADETTDYAAIDKLASNPSNRSNQKENHQNSVKEKRDVPVKEISQPKEVTTISDRVEEKKTNIFDDEDLL